MQNGVKNILHLYPTSFVERNGKKMALVAREFLVVFILKGKKISYEYTFAKISIKEG